MTSFLDAIQAHEREWGTEKYSGRPSLEQMMMSYIVAFWQPTDDKEKRLYASVHNDTKEIEATVLKTVMRLSIQKPSRVYVRAYRNKKPLKIKGVQIIFESDDSD